ncbi:choice-of-anchor tandem repeat GloVer-containing protein [Pedosphaera parvula]|uniref:Uncharacterized protein n=1 Tax=Pedosphaera parvula (strain Ellin514) TaxID=320771 RepID=B9XN24_PEDPL|nr:choice-of-anchor tandem repeat GloVer-containing protein [Pedosphaera parvula]EEF58820.1 conserved hypothetical protein [Pedosphaera parvula Ellin514]
MRVKSVFIIMALTAGFCELQPPAPAQSVTVLHAFAPVTNGTNIDGTLPYCALALSDNVLFGTTYNGGANSNGTVFAMNADGTGFTNLHVFAVRSGPLHTNVDGGWPTDGLVVSGHTLYGTTGTAGPSLRGTVFAMNTDGTGFTNLHVFNGNNDGSATVAGLTLSGGRLYGIAQSGGTNGSGMIFGMNLDGSGYTNLHSFAGLISGTNADGIQPLATLAASGTNLIGACSGGGAWGKGTVFRINTDGTGFTNWHVFSALTSGTNGDGAMPFAGGLTVNGNALFGTTKSGGSAGNGVLYRMNLDGSGFTNLHSFTAVNNLTNADGISPFGSLFSSGNTLYGTASGGGVSSNGTVFVVNTDGSGFKVLHNFNSVLNNTNDDGALPVSAIMASNTLYIVAHAGGAGGSGTVVSLFLPPPLNISFSGANAVLTWPTNADGFALQGATNLSSAAAWTPVAPIPVNNDGQFTVTNPPSSGQMFFRLAR